jgi:hypothetical protein
MRMEIRYFTLGFYFFYFFRLHRCMLLSGGSLSVGLDLGLCL